MVDARQLEMFLAVIDAPSMTRAAESLHLSTSAVSLQLRALAEELQTDLFLRIGRNLTPTPAGRRLEQHARKIIEELRAISASFESRAELDDQPFHIATGATTLLYSLNEPFRQLRERHPHVDLRVSVLPTEGIVAGLRDCRIDIGIISLPYQSSALRIMPLFSEELVLVRPSAAQSTGAVVASISAKELNGASFLLYPAHSNMRRLIDRFFQDLDIEPRVVMEAEDTEVLKRMVEEGFGSSFLPESAVCKGSGRFEVLRLAEGQLIRQQALATSKVSRPRALTRMIASSLHTQLSVSYVVHPRLDGRTRIWSPQEISCGVSKGPASIVE